MAENVGVRLFQNKQYPQSEHYFLAAINKDSKNAEAYLYLGRVYFEMWQFRKSIAVLQKAVALESKKADYHYWLARAYGGDAQFSNIFRQASLASKIRRGFKAAVRLDPKLIYPRVGLANYYMQAPRMMGGSKELALAQAAELKKLDPVEGELVYALTIERQGKIVHAGEILQRLVKRHGNTEKYSHLNDEYGYYLIRRKKVPQAIKAFEQQLVVTKNKDKAYVSLGDGYRAKGEYTRAIQSYEKAIALNKYNRKAKKNLALARMDQEDNDF